MNKDARVKRELAVLPIVETDGAELFLSLICVDGSRISVILGAGEAVAIAGDLIQAARIRMGRQNWPARVTMEDRRCP